MVTIKYLGHSCFSISYNDIHLLVDPFISGNPLLEDKRLDNIKCQYILLTHGHEDHTKDAEVIAKNNNATIISNWEIVTWYEAKGIKGHPMNTGGSWAFDFGKIKLVEAVHSSSLPDGSYGGSANGFLLEIDGKSIYLSGDTALTNNMKIIPQIWPSLDVAILPIGSNFTMDYRDAILASEFIDCNKIIGCHFDTFDFIKIKHEEVAEAFSRSGKEIILPIIGAEYTI